MYIYIYNPKPYTYIYIYIYIYIYRLIDIQMPQPSIYKHIFLSQGLVDSQAGGRLNLSPLGGCPATATCYGRRRLSGGRNGLGFGGNPVESVQELQKFGRNPVLVAIVEV